MAKLDIVMLGDARLRKKSKPIKRFDTKLKQLVEDMAQTMHESNGVGLAAPQIGINERLIVVEIPADEEEEDPLAGKLHVFVNPEIVRLRGETIVDDEGCLSIPGYIGEVARVSQVTIRGQDVNGKPIRIKTYDYLARVFLHEIDHLDGVLFIDHIEDPSRLRRIIHDPETDEYSEEPVSTIPAG